MASELNVGGVNVSEPTGGTGLTVYRAGSGADIKIGADSTRYANYGYTYATDSATIGVDGASSLSIDSAGNVGIGVAPDGIGFRAEKETNGNWAGLIKNTHATDGYGLKVQAGDDVNVKAFQVADVDNNALLTITGDGLATFSAGIAFQSATTGSGTGTGYTLDKYEEGTWTPVNSGSGSSSGTWDATLTGTYTRVGNLVTVNLKITGTTMDFSSTGGYRTYTGLPFTTSGASGGACRTNHAASFGATASVSGTAFSVIPVETGSGTNQADATATYFV